MVASGSTSDPTVTTTVTNDCSITTMSVTTMVTDSLGQSGRAAAILDPSSCPPPPAHGYAGDRILARPTLSEASFVDRLRAVGSPTLASGPAIYRRLIRAGVNPGFALGMFHAESQSGTRGYAVITKNWANILYYHWTRQYGATRYAPGNGYTYAKFPTWRAGVRAYTALLGALLAARLPERQHRVGALAGDPHRQQATPALPDQHRRGDDHPPRRRPSGHDPALGSTLESRARHGRLAGDGQPGRHRLPGQAPQGVTSVVRSRRT